MLLSMTCCCSCCCYREARAGTLCDLLSWRRVSLVTRTTAADSTRSPHARYSTTNHPACTRLLLCVARLSLTFFTRSGAHGLAAVWILAKYGIIFPSLGGYSQVCSRTTSRCCCCCYRGVRTATPRDLILPPSAHTVRVPAVILPPRDSFLKHHRLHGIFGCPCSSRTRPAPVITIGEFRRCRHCIPPCCASGGLR